MPVPNHARSHVLFLALCLAVFSNTALTRAETSRQRISAMDVFEFRTVADPQISPDGRHIVYMLNFADIRTDTRYSNLWTIDYDGAGNRPITSGNFHDSSPRWSPDGKRIAFISDRDGSPGIYERWVDTGEIHKLTNLPEAPSGLAWSPDGQQIAFLSLVADQPRKLGKLPDPPQGAKWADPPHIIDKLVYRFDQAGYLKPGETQLFIVAADGSAPRQISQGKLNIGPGTLGGGSTPVWSPDSKSIILSANRNADAEDNPLNTDIYEFSVGDGSVKTLTTRKGPDNSPALSRDGRRIAYVGFDDRRQGYQVAHLYVMFRDGSNARDLAPDLDRDVSNPRWYRLDRNR